MLTVYGIETILLVVLVLQHTLVATVLTVYGIETCQEFHNHIFLLIYLVATVLTVYGIET